MTTRLSSRFGSISMHAIRLVGRREMRVRLRSRVFAASTVVMVVLVAGSLLAASYLRTATASQPPSAVHVGFSGGAQSLEPSFRSFVAALGQTVTVTEVADAAAGRAQVQAGSLDMAVSGSATAPTAVVSDSVPSLVEIALDAATQDARMAAAGLTPAAISSVLAGVPFEQVQRTGSSSPGMDQSTSVGVIVAILLYISLGMYGGFVAQGVVEEKATRIMEILLATVRPTELLAGKIFGVGLVGLLQLGIVVAAGLLAGGLTQSVSIPAIGVVEVACYFAWFVLGFLLYATAFASVAALVSRQEEVQGTVAPVNILLIGSYALSLIAVFKLTSAWSAVLSMVPPLAPILMTMRIAQGVAEPWEVGLAMGLTLTTIGGMVWLAGRIYANSAMRIGTRVRFLEAFRG